ncbi:MAG: histone deacetylase [Motiliproteus sp.]
MKHPKNVPLVYSPHYSISWNPKHRFPMAKYLLLYEYLSNAGLASKENVYISSPASRKQLALAHSPAYVDRFIAGDLSLHECKQLGLIWSNELVRRTLTAVGGTILTCKLASQHGIACHLAGGTHHAFRDQGAGFCVFNDIAVAAKNLLETGQAKSVLIIDCDVHQGDGTAKIMAEEPRCFTCSMHARTNFPFEKMISDLDIEIERGTGDKEYLEILDSTLAKLDQQINADFVIYDGGSDVHQDDRLGHLQLSDEGIRQRDHKVIGWAKSRGIPIACVIGGGYDHDHHKLALRHSLLPKAAEFIYQQRLR